MLNKSIWDYWADKYDNLWVQKYSLGPTRTAIIKALIPILNKTLKYKILDMGCGTGQLIREMRAAFREYNIEYVGVDISPKMIEICRLKDSKTVYYASSIDDFQYQREQFDIIICSHSFPYYPNKPSAINSFYNLLNKDGLLILAQASSNSIYDNFIMFFVKFTTSRARYLSIKDIMNLVVNKFKLIFTIEIKEKFYMPTICLFSLRKGISK